jgi:hypothetical protein
MSTGYRIGARVIAADGEAGQIEDVLVDKDGTPRYLVVRDNGVFASDAVIPVEAASTDGGPVRSTLTKAQIHAGDRYDEHRFGEGAGLFSSAAGNFDRG